MHAAQGEAIVRIVGAGEVKTPRNAGSACAIIDAEVSDMATTREQIEELRKEVRRLKNESTETRRILREHGLWPIKHKKGTQLSERERARLILQQANVARELTPAEQALADEWRALPAEEQREVEVALQQVRMDPPLSQLIHDLRG